MIDNPPPEPDVGRLLDRASGPALAVAVAAARIVGTNGPGGAWLCGTAAEAGPSLDAAMPAIQRLRAMAQGEPNGHSVRERLTFWTQNGVRTTDCDIVLVPGTAGERIAVVEIVMMDGPADPIQSLAPTGGPRSPRSDAETLREIARRIREGQLGGAGMVGGEAESNVASRSNLDVAATAAGGPVVIDPGQTADAGGAPAGGEHSGARSVRLAKLAHELKTPLSAIVAAAEIMRDERLGPIENTRYRSYAADIYDSARHALMVIASMLGDSGDVPDAGDVAALPPMVFAEIDLGIIAESCGSSMRPLADAAGLALSIELPQRLPHVIADATAMRQIVLNLLNNALKFTARGGMVRLTARHEPGGTVEIEVADTGRGMTRQEIERAGAAGAEGAIARREGGGLGIGLPLVGALARANGAEIEISSEPMRGTRVVVSFAKDRVVPV